MDPRLSTTRAAVATADSAAIAARPQAATDVRVRLIQLGRYPPPRGLSMMATRLTWWCHHPPQRGDLRPDRRSPLTSGHPARCQDDHRCPACMLPPGGTGVEDVE